VHSTSTLPGLRTIDISPPSTLAVPLTTSSTIGYVAVVIDGATFDLQAGPTVKRFVVPHIQVPPIGTCEGALSRSLLASMIAGKEVRIDPEGLVFHGDIDVGMAMVSYGMAVHVGEWYQAADANSPDINCANTTTTLLDLPVIVVQPPRQRPVRPTVAEAPAEPTPVTEPAPEETAPPPARPEPPRETDPPPQDTEPEQPRETKAPKTDPEPQVTDEPDRTPKTPRPPKTPDVPDVTG